MDIEDLFQAIEKIDIGEVGVIVAFAVGLILIPVLLGFARLCGLYTCINECESHVFTLFGKVIGTMDKPGLRYPLVDLGFRSLLLPFFGNKYVVKTALRQHYMRNQMVNSEEGTPMGVGIWYEMRVSDPIAYLFTNANPEGSLQANVTSSTISTLSNLEMEKMLEDRHSLSRTVRQAVSPLSEKWGYKLGSVYIRKVAFTDRAMVENITEKVVKRLVQVTSAMKQDGENRVGLIKSETAFKVSQKMAEAAASRPEIVGQVLQEISNDDPEVLDAVLEVMEVDQLLASGASVDILPQLSNVLIQMGDANRSPTTHRSL